MADEADQPSEALPPDEQFDEQIEPADGPGELHNALPARVEAWRRRTVTGALLTGVARGLGQVFDPEPERAAIVAEMSGAPPPPPGPVEAQIDPDDPEASRLIVRRWMIDADSDADDTGDASA